MHTSPFPRYLSNDLVLLLILATVKVSSLWNRRYTDNHCSGTQNGLSFSTPSRHSTLEEIAIWRWENLRELYEGCQVVHQNLEITNFPEWITPDKMTFLKDIEEVRGYVLIAMNEFEEISLPKLKIIWGEKLVELHRVNTDNTSVKCEADVEVGPSLRMFNNPNLKIVNMASLKTIARGSVKTRNNPRLCHISTVDWFQILGSDFESRLDLEPAQCYASPRELCPNCIRPNCWGPEESQCQDMYRSGCSSRCGKESMCFEKHSAVGCCASTCLNGCNGPTNYDCHVCKDFEQDAQMLIDGQSCVSRCPPNRYTLRQFDKSVMQRLMNETDDEDALRKCIPCPEDQECKTCEIRSSLGITSQNIDELENCTMIESSLVIRNIAFMNTTVFNDDTCTYEKLTAITPEQLFKLRSIRYVAGHVDIALHFPPGELVPKWLDNATFLEHLETIDGRDTMLKDSLYALYIGHSDFKFLGLRSLRRISNGLIIITSNSNLCYSHNIPWGEIAVDNRALNRIWDNNRLIDICADRVCNPECNQAKGCWGPGPLMCYECAHFTMIDTNGEKGYCVRNCSLSNGFYQPSNSTCQACHPYCETCYSDGADKCDTCKYFKKDGLCVAKSSSSQYLTNDGHVNYVVPNVSLADIKSDAHGNHRSEMVLMIGQICILLMTKL